MAVLILGSLKQSGTEPEAEPKEPAGPSTANVKLSNDKDTWLVILCLRPKRQELPNRNLRNRKKKESEEAETSGSLAFIANG